MADAIWNVLLASAGNISEQRGVQAYDTDVCPVPPIPPLAIYLNKLEVALMDVRLQGYPQCYQRGILNRFHARQYTRAFALGLCSFTIARPEYRA